jgi:hypothetical protein
MALRTDFKSDPLIELGLGVPPLEEQCARQGFVLKDAALWEERHKAWILLNLGGFLTNLELTRIGVRLMNGIRLSVGFEAALTQLRVPCIENEPEHEAPDPEEAAGEVALPLVPLPSADALDSYLEYQRA